MISALAATGSNDLVPLIAGIAIGIVVLGGVLLVVRAVLARRAKTSTSGDTPTDTPLDSSGDASGD